MEKHSAQSNDRFGALVAAGGLFKDFAESHGLYRADCVGPRDKMRAEYLRCRDQLGRLERYGSIDFRARMLLRSRMEGMLENKWQDHIDNLWTTVGKNDALDKYLAGSAYTATWYMGLISSVSYGAGLVAADTAASHAGWLEAGGANAPTYSQGTRPPMAFSAASAGSKSTSSASVFSITSTGTLKGLFVINTNTKDSGTGTLFSGGVFSGGDRPVINGDTVNGSYTASLT